MASLLRRLSLSQPSNTRCVIVAPKRLQRLSNEHALLPLYLSFPQRPRRPFLLERLPLASPSNRSTRYTIAVPETNLQRLRNEQAPSILLRLYANTCLLSCTNPTAVAEMRTYCSYDTNLLFHLPLGAAAATHERMVALDMEEQRYHFYNRPSLSNLCNETKRCTVAVAKTRR